jgi:YD repeat-containing protein
LKKVNKKATGDSIYEYEYNEDNKLSKEILPLGNGYTYSYDDRLNLIEKRMKKDVHTDDSAEDLVTNYEYHPVFNIKTRVVNTNGLITDITLDENGNVIQTQTT